MKSKTATKDVEINGIKITLCNVPKNITKFELRLLGKRVLDNYIREKDIARGII